jgi:hypothetical protein
MDNLKLHTLFMRRRYFEALFTLNVYNGFIICPSFLEAACIRVSSRNFKYSYSDNFILRFHVMNVVL